MGTVADDSFDLFYGLYKYNPNSVDTLLLLRKALVDLEWRLKEMDRWTQAPRVGKCATLSRRSQTGPAHEPSTTSNTNRPGSRPACCSHMKSLYRWVVAPDLYQRW